MAKIIPRTFNIEGVDIDIDINTHCPEELSITVTQYGDETLTNTIVLTVNEVNQLLKFIKEEIDVD